MSTNYKIDDEYCLKAIDNKLASLEISELLRIKNELLKDNKDTSIIDKAINENKRRTIIMEKEKEREDKERSKQFRRGLFWGLVSGLTSDSSSSSNNSKSDNDLMPWEEDAIKNDHYEPHNFEEEELEEDDYYYDDDK